MVTDVHHYLHIFNWFILRRDYFDYLWGTWVLGYDRQQARFLQNLLGQVTTARVVTLFLVAAYLLAVQLHQYFSSI